MLPRPAPTASEYLLATVSHNTLRLDEAGSPVVFRSAEATRQSEVG